MDDETYRAYADRGERVTRDGKKITDARTLAGQIGLAKTMRKYKLRRIISFHGRVKAAQEFSTEMPDVIARMPPRARPAGTLWSKHVSGAMTSGNRDRMLLRFRDLFLSGFLAGAGPETQAELVDEAARRAALNDDGPWPNSGLNVRS